jgi:hypothetical protein
MPYIYKDTQGINMFKKSLIYFLDFRRAGLRIQRSEVRILSGTPFIINMLSPPIPPGVTGLTPERGGGILFS